MKPHLVIVVAVLILGGCATFSSLPPEARVIARTAVSSPRVVVEKPKLKLSAGVYSVEGVVRRNFTRESTAGSSLDVALFNAAGDKLKEAEVDFTPAELPMRGGRHGRYGNYRLTLGVLPPGTARIEVRAHDAGPPVDG